MGLRTRLLWIGAAIPLVLLFAAVVGAGLVFDRVILEEHDHLLLGQAGVEAVSLFDRADSPHLHLLESPLDRVVRDFAPRGALYAPDGTLVTRYPADADVPTHMDPRHLSTEPQLQTVHDAIGRDRQLRVRVDDPEGRPYGLWLAASLYRHDREIESYWQIAGLALLLTSSVLLVVQIWHANRLGARIGNLRSHMNRLRAGELNSAPPEDPVEDEIGELRGAIAEATTRLAAAHNSQERMIADAAHELRTPLAALRAEIDVALRRERSADQLRESLEHARIEVDRLGALSSHLLDLAALRASPIRRERVDMVGILVEAIDAARALAETRSCVVCLEAPEQAMAEIAAGALRQTLDNLLSNAIKYAPRGSAIEVDLRQSCEKNTWHFEVRDHGPGIPAEVRKQVFEPFFTINDETQRDNRGAGLGLAIVKATALRHGGTVEYQSRNGGGSIFTLTLPSLLPEPDSAIT